ncbi:MAG: cysteine peptidase family C39 domain-containing protein [Myxococcales bacterium]
MMILPLFATALALFAAGYAGWRRASRRCALLVAGAAIALPWGLFPAYYLHLPALDAPWYFQWRSQAWTDLLPAGVGLLSGCFAGWLRERARVDQHAGGRPPWGWAAVARGLGVLAGLLVIAFAKPWLGTLPASKIHDEWRDGVCLQSTPSTCGPCAAATILKTFGEPATELQLAHEASSTRTGTLNWLLARALRSRGFDATFTAPEQVQEVVAPAILGVKVGAAGHFVALLERTGEQLVIADPLEGRLSMTVAEFERRYPFARFALSIRRAAR